jgi:hypothetical protein
VKEPEERKDSNAEQSDVGVLVSSVLGAGEAQIPDDNGRDAKRIKHKD